MRLTGPGLVLCLATAGCGWLGAGPSCEDDPTRSLETAGEHTLTCAEVEVGAQFVELVAGRAISVADRRQLVRGMRKRFAADPQAALAALAAARTEHTALGALRGMAAAERRSALAYQSVTGAGPLGAASGDDVTAVMERAIAVWARSDTDGLALTEVDIEGWILYASLCREVQRAGPMRLSVADRIGVYREVEDLFDQADRGGRVALVAIGPFWPAVRLKWAVATYERQQGWASAAPLPPPMLSTSKGYLSAILEVDARQHAAALHEAFGPLALAVAR